MSVVACVAWRAVVQPLAAPYACAQETRSVFSGTTVSRKSHQCNEVNEINEINDA
jgi:hypothetical protein